MSSFGITQTWEKNAWKKVTLFKNIRKRNIFVRRSQNHLMWHFLKNFLYNISCWKSTITSKKIRENHASEEKAVTKSEILTEYTTSSCTTPQTMPTLRFKTLIRLKYSNYSLVPSLPDKIQFYRYLAVNSQKTTLNVLSKSRFSLKSSKFLISFARDCRLSFLKSNMKFCET